MSEPVAPAFTRLTGFKLNNASMSELCVLTQTFSHKSRVLSRRAAAHRSDHKAVEPRVLSRENIRA